MRACILTLLWAVAGAWACTPTGADNESFNMASFSSVTIGVADIDQALELWESTFGLSVMDRHEGPDEALARLWGLDAHEIVRQALVATPGTRLGMLHLVQFDEPAPPVRADADVFDLCPKNLDIYVRDMATQFEDLRSRGLTFRNETFSDVTAPNGVRFREIHMAAHDDINVVLLELVGKPMGFAASGYAGVGPLIAIVADAAREKAFLADVLGLAELSDNTLAGPDIEKMVGLPAGAALKVSIWGKAGMPFGQMEIVEYEGVDGADLYPRTRPKSLGILHVTYMLETLDPLRRRLDGAGHPWTEHGPVQSMIHAGDTIAFTSPAGLRMEATAPR